MVDASELSDEQLAAEAARERSDGPAFLALLERYRRPIWRVCFRLLSNEHDAHDAAQEVFLQLFLQRAKFAGRSKYSTWAHGIALRKCLTLRRSRGRRRRHEDVVAERGERAAALGTTPTTTTGLSLDLRQMLDTLDEEDRALLILKYAENYDYEALAEVFGLSVSACKMRVSRARARLRRGFPEHDPKATEHHG